MQIFEKLKHQYKEGKKKEMFFLFNNTLNTFYLQFYGIRYMVKDHSESTIPQTG